METVTFKGNKEGITMVLDGSVEFESLCQIIVQKLWQARDFLGEHTKLIVNTKEYPLSEGEQLALKVLLQSLGHTVLRFVSDAPQTPLAQPEVQETPMAEPEAEVTFCPEASAEVIADTLGSSQHPLEMYLDPGHYAGHRPCRRRRQQQCHRLCDEAIAYPAAHRRFYCQSTG